MGFARRFREVHAAAWAVTVTGHGADAYRCSAPSPRVVRRRRACPGRGAAAGPAKRGARYGDHGGPVGPRRPSRPRARMARPQPRGGGPPAKLCRAPHLSLVAAYQQGCCPRPQTATAVPRRPPTVAALRLDGITGRRTASSTA